MILLLLVMLIRISFDVCMYVYETRYPLPSLSIYPQFSLPSLPTYLPTCSLRTTLLQMIHQTASFNQHIYLVPIQPWLPTYIPT